MLFCIFMQRGGNDLESLDDKEEGTKLIFFPLFRKPSPVHLRRTSLLSTHISTLFSHCSEFRTVASSSWLLIIITVQDDE